ncbi:MAG: hypothetical protein OXK73_05605, partial [Rhodospirillaceae bacterium]|nr:hypothetical protein [Rhodospirillaceae bacterium]
AIASTVDHTMIAAIEDITVQEGIDPRESYFVAGGGATALHMGQMARVLGIKGYMVPKFSAGLSAFGGLISDIVWEETATLVTDAARFDVEGVNGVLAMLEERGRAFLARAGIAEADRRFDYAYLGRYQYQSWEIEVPFVARDGARKSDRTDGALAAADVPGLADGFHRMHERIYTIKNENDLVEFTTWKVRAIGPAAAELASAEGTATAGAAAPHGTRRVHLPGRDAPETVPVYRGNDLAPGARVAGPAIVEEATTTVLVPEDAEAVIDPLGNYRVTLI